MSCGSLTPPVQQSLTAQPNTAAFAWFKGWAPCTGLASFRAVLKVKAVTGNFRAQVVAQFAAVRPDEPDTTAVSYGSAQSGAGEICVDAGDVLSTAATKFFVRYGVKYDLSTGSTPATADVELQVSEDTCGQVLGALTEQLVATSDTKLFLAISGWVPAIQAKKIKATVLVTSLGGNFKWRLTYRTAQTSKESPSAWDANWDLTNNPERDAGEFDTGELTPSTDGKMWVQVGIMYYLSANYTGPGQASVTTAVAVRK